MNSLLSAVKRNSFGRTQSPAAYRTSNFRPGDDMHYIAFYKPYEILTQFSRPEGSGKETLAAFGFPADVYPVGRLDYDSEGLLLLSDDPALNNALLHPSNHHPRTYLVQVDGIPDEDDLARLRKGLPIEGVMTQPAFAELLEEPPAIPPRSTPIRFRKEIPAPWLRLTITEGRNRQVRRMTAAIGHPTLRLLRQKIGALDLLAVGLAPGEWIELTHAQLLEAMQH